LKSDSEGALLDACAAAREIKLGVGVRLAPVVDPR
jgi:hypothetical protein